VEKNVQVVQVCEKLLTDFVFIKSSSLMTEVCLI